MKAELERLIQALREELIQYGEALELLDQQQELIARKSATELLQNVEAITGQVEKLTLPRERRDVLRRDLARALGKSEASTFHELVHSLPPIYQPLLAALIDEVNSLLNRAQKRLMENNLLLQHSLKSNAHNRLECDHLKSRFRSSASQPKCSTMRFRLPLGSPSNWMTARRRNIR